MNIGDIFAGVAWCVNWLVGALGVTKTALDTTKAATDLVETGKKLLHVGSPDDAPTEQEVARARAAADLLRSFVLFGLLEYLLWATKVVAILFVFTRWFDIAIRPLMGPRKK